MTKQLAGDAAGTAAWVTDVGNEHGQVLMSVLTESEGDGLLPMAAGLVRRYLAGGKAPPQVLYVDRDCCSVVGRCKTAEMFGEWDQLVVRLDVFHLMRRFASGVTTVSHPLYGVFMARLSLAIFEWDGSDVTRLQEARQSPLDPTSRDLARHCRQRTRGVEETEQLIQELLDSMWEVTDTMGVPLIDRPKMEDIWSTQRGHLRCIQDPPGVELYAKTGEVIRGGTVLPVYRCARGSTSLESFHLHLCQFIPGTSALHLQVYLLEDPVRCNDARRSTARCPGLQEELPGIEAILRNEPRQPAVAEEQQQQEEEVVLGPDGHGGYQHAVHLAQALVQLRERLYVRPGQVREIGALWQKLSDRDKAPISFPPRYQKRLTKSRFRSSGSETSTTASVDSVTWSYLRHAGSAAQFPDVSRLLEAVFMELCSIHQEGRTLAGVRVNRWGLIRRDYFRIRENLYSSRELSKAAPVQLPEVNQRTLLQWHHKRSKRVETVCQGMPGPSQQSAAELFPPARAPPLFKILASSAGIVASTSASHAVASTSASQAVASTSAAHPVASTSASNAVASTSAAHTVASTSAAHAVASTSAAHPVASTSASQAVASTSAAHPVASTSASDAVASTSAAHPVASTSASQAVASTSAAHPVASTSASDAVASTSAAHPVASTSASQAVASTSAAHPVASTSAAQAVASTSASDAVASTSAAHPVASTSAAHPVASTSAAHPVASTSASQAVAFTSAAPTTAVPKTTAWQRKVREEQERRKQALGLPTKSRKKTEHYTCQRCGQPKTREYGHSRYRSQHFCSRAEGRSVEDWLEEKRAEEVAERQQGRAASQTPSSQTGSQQGGQ